MLGAAAIYALWIGENYRLAAAMTAVSYGLAAMLALALREVRPEKRQEKSGKLLLGQLKDRKILYLVLAAALLGETHQSITVFLNQLKYEAVGMNHGAISLAFIAVSLSGLAGGFSARLRERFGAKRMGSTLLLLAAVCCLVLAGTGSALLSVAAVLMLRGCYSLFSPLYQELQNRAVRTVNRATALSMNAVIHDALGVFLNLLFGFAAQWQISGAFALGVALCILGWRLFGKSLRE